MFVDGLPGAPDNIKKDKNGNFHVSLVLPRDEEHLPSIMVNIGKYPLLRKFISRSVAFVQTIFTVADSVYPHVVLKKLIHGVS